MPLLLSSLFFLFLLSPMEDVISIGFNLISYLKQTKLFLNLFINLLGIDDSDNRGICGFVEEKKQH